MRNKPYYSVRTGKHDGVRAYNLDITKRLFLGAFRYLEDEGYFQEAFGFHCVDADFIPGSFGPDVEAALLLELGKTQLWPIYDFIAHYSEDDLFDVIELLYEYVSEPTKREYHTWNDCGWHCSEFDKDAGRSVFREKMNEVLALYSGGFVLTEEGEILSSPEDGMSPLEAAPLPNVDPDNVRARVEAAQRKFRRHGSSIEERRDAIRDLVDVLEYLRPQVKEALLSKDERDLYQIANSFGIRHHRSDQQDKYDKAIWYSWMYYYYLATIHAVIRLIDRQQTE